MKNRNAIILVVILILCVAGYFFFVYFKEFLPKYRWIESYRYDDDNPYGLKITYEIFESICKKNNFVFIDSPPKDVIIKTDKNSSYIFIGAKWVADSLTVENFCEFVKNGNYAYISSYDPPYELIDKLCKNEYQLSYYDTFPDSVIETSFVNSNKTEKPRKFNFHCQYLKKKKIYWWSYIDRKHFLDSLSVFGFKPVSEINSEKINCYKITYGKGHFVFHTTPFMLTNYHTVRQEGYEYMNTLFAELKTSKIYWDEYSKAPHFNWQYQSFSEQNPLRYLLSQRGLRWGWYLSLVAVLIYLVFNSKREQQIIPLMPENNNTSAEFVKAVGTLHYQLRSYDVLVDEILKLFLAFVRNRYSIPSHLEKEMLTEEIIRKSGIPEKYIRGIFKLHLAIKYNPNPENKDIISFHSMVEQFYLKCK